MKDLLMLESVDEDLVVEEIIKRYKSSQVYTFLGPVLIAVNPYKLLIKNGQSIYDVRSMEDFSGKERHQCDPHPFAIAEDAYSNLMRFSKDQSLLITGESGSGKTETSKQVMQYITTMSTKFRSRNAAQLKRRLSMEQRQEIDANVAHVTEILWSSNHILEAFGNAQTIRNSNSSRFGKYTILQFNHPGQVIGGQIEHYLLEKSRIIQQAQGERNFHVFYQMLYGSNDIEKSKWKLHDTNIKDFHFLLHEEKEKDQTNHDQVQQKKDVQDFLQLKEKMKAIGLKEEIEIDQLFSTLSAILWLGNIKFQDEEDQHDLYHVTRATIKEEQSQFALQQAASLLHLTSNELEKMLTQRTLKIATSKKQPIFFDTRQATKVTHSLARSVYGKLFDWLVFKINQGISANHTKVPSITKNSIGILDLYGFEIFQVNAFEQLCINYVNEKLQQLFIQQTLQQEQKEYHKEQIPWQDISYFNNQKVCELIEQQPSSEFKQQGQRQRQGQGQGQGHEKEQHGLFSLLDEQIAISRFDPFDLIQRFEKFHHVPVKKIKKTRHFIKSKMQGTTFCIQHYAGQVEYDVTNFFDANVDTFYPELANTLSTIKSNGFLHEIFFLSLSIKEKPHSLNDSPGKGKPTRRPLSTCQQFRQQVKELLTQLETCQPHYIRCIKPNENKQPLGVNQQLIQEQVKYLGLVENLSIRRQGYSYKETYASFLQRYKLLSKETWPHVASHSSRQGALEVLTAHDVGVNDPFNEKKLIPFEQDGKGLGAFALGKNKIFLRHPQALSSLEIARENKLPLIVQILEKAYQRYRIRCRIAHCQQMYTLVKQAYTQVLDNCLTRRARRPGVEKNIQLINHWIKMSTTFLPEKNKWQQILDFEEKLNVICFAQSFIRAQTIRRTFLKLKKAQIVFSKTYRGLLVRRQMPNDFYHACKKALLGVRTEFERFMGEKKRRRDSLDRPYTKDYIGIREYPLLGAILRGRLDASHQKLLFLAHVIKINERFAHQPRILLVGEEYFFNIKSDPKISKPLERRAIYIKNLTGIYMSTLPDDYVILQVQKEFDLFVQVKEKTELVQTLRHRYRVIMQGKELPVIFGNSIEFFALKGRKNHVTFGFDRSKNHVEHRKVDRRTMHVTVGVL